jgi:histidine triad (HIT) family protein
MTDDSIFTRIIRGELPGRFVWRDDDVVAFGTIAPIRPGHVLVVPVHQVDKWTDLRAEIWAHTTTVAQVIAQVLETAFECDRVGVIVAGLEVPHCHVHLIPIRTEGDLNFALADPGASAVSLDEAAEQIRAGLRAAGHEDHVPSS